MTTELCEQAITDRIGQMTVPSRLGVKTTLGPVTALLERLGHPQRDFPVIHVGGTSGKGSTATFLANILHAAGYRTGLFTKPHLQTVRERFLVNRLPITPEAIMALLDRMPRDLELTPTWFELLTALAFQHFSDQHVDFGVIEVGLGGMYDATNVLLPELSILTNVGLDHCDVLGDTVEQIAADKVGIVKAGRPVVSGVRQPGVINIVNEQCRRLGSPLYLLGQDFHFSVVALEAGGSVFDFEMAGMEMRDLALVMPGHHQVANAAVALAAAQVLRMEGHHIPDTAIRNGLAETRVPGRLEIISEHPTVVLDGAHSPPKMEALSTALRTLFADKSRVIAVLGFSKGHNAMETLAPLVPLLDTAILTEFTALTDYGDKRAQNGQEIRNLMIRQYHNVQAVYEPDPIAAIQTAIQMAGPDDLICVTGSIFLVGQVREYFASVQGEKHVSHP